MNSHPFKGDLCVAVARVQDSIRQLVRLRDTATGVSPTLQQNLI